MSPSGIAIKTQSRASGTSARMPTIMPIVITAPIQPLTGIFSMRGPQCGSIVSSVSGKSGPQDHVKLTPPGHGRKGVTAAVIGGYNESE